MCKPLMFNVRANEELLGTLVPCLFRPVTKLTTTVSRNTDAVHILCDELMIFFSWVSPRILIVWKPLYRSCDGQRDRHSQNSPGTNNKLSTPQLS